MAIEPAGAVAATVELWLVARIAIIGIARAECTSLIREMMISNTILSLETVAMEI